MARKPDLRIEISSGETYHHPGVFVVYEYDTYPSTSVLAGQQRRWWIEQFDSVEAAKAQFPNAVEGGCGWQAPSLHHLPDDAEY